MSNDQWVVDGLPVNGDWQSACGCAPPDSVTSSVDTIQITGAPGAVTSVANDQNLWAVVLNDGTPQVDFAIQRFNSGQLVDSPITIVRATGVVTFHDPVMLAADPQQPLEAATKEYVDSKTTPPPSTTPPLMDGTAAPGTATAWSRGDHVHPSDTSRYAASNPAGYQTGAQVSASLSAYLPLAGGTLTGNLSAPTLIATTGIAGTSGGAPPVILNDPPAADSSASVPSTRWVRSTVTSMVPPPGATVTVSDTAPTTPKVGDLWWDSVSGQMFLWYQDPNSTQWVVTNNSGAAARVTIGDVAPSSPHNGDMWFDSVGSQTYIWFTDANSSQWVIANNFSGGAYLPKQGVTDGSDAPTGQIGEVISSLNATAVTLTSGTTANVASISLTPGDWDVQGEVWILFGAGGGTSAYAGIGAGSATLPSISLGSSRLQFALSFVANAYAIMPLSPCRVSLSATTTYYLVGQGNFPSGTTTAIGKLWARRAR
jgi:hypothetical protein